MIDRFPTRFVVCEQWLNDLVDVLTGRIEPERAGVFARHRATCLACAIELRASAHVVPGLRDAAMRDR